MKDFFTFLREFSRLFWNLRSILLVMLALVVAASAVLWLVEPLSFGDALYMSFITAFTIGYGDLVPLTVTGKLVSIFVGFVGLIFIGLSVAIATVAVKNTVGEE